MAHKNGKGKQDAILARFKHDARSTVKTAWQQALEDGNANKAYKDEQSKKREEQSRFVPSSKAYYGID